MSPTYSGHELIWRTIKDLDSVDEPKLVARLHDERIGNGGNPRVYLLIPDMHLISRDKIGTRYQYGFNHERMFVDIMKAIKKLKKDPSVKLTLVQLGDYVDLWKENTDNPRNVVMQYGGVTGHMFRYSPGRNADCQFVVGNHDAKLANAYPTQNRWHHRVFLRHQTAYFGYVTHGDVFDWIEKLPVALKKWAVHLFSPKEKEPATGLEDIIEIKNHYSSPRAPDETCPIESDHVDEQTVLDYRIRVVDNHKFLDKCYERLRETNRDSGLKIKFAVIGHTHSASLTVRERDGDFLAMMDCGAWYGSHRTETGAEKANCQLGVLCGNDARIYQIDADEQKSRQFEDEPVR